MSGYLLDTPLITAYLRGRPGAVALINPWISTNIAGTSIVTYGESIEYLRSFPDSPKWQSALRAMLRQIRVYDLTYAILERYADVRRTMRPPHGPGLIGDIDSLIAATSLVYNLTVVTLDGDYTRVPGLAVMHLPRNAL
jgi:predicted nucleic acid-binding protein